MRSYDCETTAAASRPASRACSNTLDAVDPVFSAAALAARTAVSSAGAAFARRFFAPAFTLFFALLIDQSLSRHGRHIGRVRRQSGIMSWSRALLHLPY